MFTWEKKKKRKKEEQVDGERVEPDATQFQVERILYHETRRTTSTKLGQF